MLRVCVLVEKYFTIYSVCLCDAADSNVVGGTAGSSMHWEKYFSDKICFTHGNVVGGTAGSSMHWEILYKTKCRKKKIILFIHTHTHTHAPCPWEQGGQMVISGKWSYIKTFDQKIVLFIHTHTHTHTHTLSMRARRANGDIRSCFTLLFFGWRNAKIGIVWIIMWNM